MKAHLLLSKTAGICAGICAALMLTACAHDAQYCGASVAGYDGKWTTVVYMAADNDLESAAIDDLREMVAGAAGLGEAGHTVLVLCDRSAEYDKSCGNWSDTRLFKIEPADSSCLDDFSFMQLDCSPLGLKKGIETELDMSASETLSRLLRFAQNEYSAANYALIMWGHGCGWRGYAIDEDAGGVMSLPALHEAVSDLESPLSVIAFDCCYGAMLETAYELRNDAEVLIATERDEPASGWNYTYLLRYLTQKGEPSAVSPAERYARCAVNAFGKRYASQRGVAVTAICLKKIETLFNSFDVWSRNCAGSLETRAASVFFSDEVASGQGTFLTGEYPAYRFIDIQSMTDAFLEKGLPSAESARYAAIASAAGELREALAASTLFSFTGGAGFEDGMSEQPMLAVYLATVRAGGVVETDYPLLYVKGSGARGQSAFVRDSTGWVPHYTVTQSTSLLDRLYRMPLP